MNFSSRFIESRVNFVKSQQRNHLLVGFKVRDPRFSKGWPTKPQGISIFDTYKVDEISPEISKGRLLGPRLINLETLHLYKSCS